jgi:hypothetical protein
MKSIARTGRHGDNHVCLPAVAIIDDVPVIADSERLVSQCGGELAGQAAGTRCTIYDGVIPCEQDSTTRV